MGGVDIPFPTKYRWGLRDGVTGPMEPFPKVIHLHMGLCILELLTTSCGAWRILKLINIPYCFLKICSDGVECADSRISPRSSHGQWSKADKRLSQPFHLANIQTPRGRLDLPGFFAPLNTHDKDNGVLNLCTDCNPLVALSKLSLRRSTISIISGSIAAVGSHLTSQVHCSYDNSCIELMPGRRG